MDKELAVKHRRAITKMEFSRARGIVWVCDLADSSRYLNDNGSAELLEEFLPRLLWTSISLVESFDGEFIKWTGDGFLAWFPVKLHRDLTEAVTRVNMAAWQLSLMINVTQLAVGPQNKRFQVRHGVTYEQDALVLEMTGPDSNKSLDLIGRAVVLAFRISGIKSKFPCITTVRELVQAYQALDRQGRVCDFEKWVCGRDEKLKYFKGESWGIESIFQSVSKTRNKKPSIETITRRATAALELANQKNGIHDPHVREFIASFTNGPDWCRQTITEYTRYIREDLVGCLKMAIDFLKKLPNNNKDGVRLPRKS